MKIISIAEALQWSTTQQQDALLIPAAVLEKKAETDNFVIAAYMTYVYFQGAPAYIGAPVYNVVANSGAGTAATGLPTGYVDDDYDVSYILGTGYGLMGSLLARTNSTTAPTTAGYGWVQTGGLNLVALTTDGNATAGNLAIGTSADGVWGNALDVQAAGATFNLIAYSTGSSQVGGIYLAADDSTAQAAYTAMLNSYAGRGNLI